MGESTTKINKSAGQRLHCREEQMSLEWKFGWEMQERPNEEWKAAYPPTPPRWAQHPQTPLGDVSLHWGFLYSPFPLNSHICIFFSFFPQSWIPKHLLETWSPGTAGWRHQECWTEMGSGEVQKSRSGYVFCHLIWRKHKTKGKSYGFVLNLGVVNMTCTSSCTSIWEILLCPFPSKFMIHRWAVVSISIFCQGSRILLEILLLFTAISHDYL